MTIVAIGSIKRAVGRPWNSMLFFDDLPWNVQQADKLGAVGVRVEAGMTVEVLLSGLREPSHRLQANERRLLGGEQLQTQEHSSSSESG